MSTAGGIAIGLGLLAIAAALALARLAPPEAGAEVGRYVLLQAAPGSVYRIDSATGDTWISLHGEGWRVIDEDDQDSVGAEPSPARAALR